MLKAVLISVIFCETIALAVISISVTPFQHQNPPREYHGGRAGEYQESAKPEAHPSPIKIECDPNCRDASGEEKGNENWWWLILKKSLNDPVALFTGLLTFVTALLVWATVRDSVHMRRLERAYMVGGGSRVLINGRPVFSVDVGNYGKTIAELLTIEWGFDSVPSPQHHLPCKPRYTEIYHYRDTFAPSHHKAGVLRISVPLGIPDPVIFGQFTYRDVGKKRFKSRFIHDLSANAGPGRPVAAAPDAYTYWN